MSRLERLEALSQEVARCTFGIEALLIDWCLKSVTPRLSEVELTWAVWEAGQGALGALLEETQRGMGRVEQQRHRG